MNLAGDMTEKMASVEMNHETRGQALRDFSVTFRLRNSNDNRDKGQKCIFIGFLCGYRLGIYVEMFHQKLLLICVKGNEKGR